MIVWHSVFYILKIVKALKGVFNKEKALKCWLCHVVYEYAGDVVVSGQWREWWQCSVATSQAAHHLIIHPPGPAPPHLATTSQQQATADDLKAIRLKHQRRPDHCPLLSQSPMFRN